MATRLEELHGHQYSMQRIVSALTHHDPDPGGRRGPRHLTLTLVSAMIAALLLVGVLVYGVITGRGTPTQLRGTTSVLIEKETGAQFVYVKSDDRLHPVLNFASGLLLAEGSGGQATTVRRDRLADLRRDEKVQLGATLGIPDAPNSLPQSRELIREPWAVCVQGVGTAASSTDVLIGTGAVGGGRALAVASADAAGEALLVRVPDQQNTFLVFGNRKLRLANSAVALAAFGWAGRQAQTVTAAWLNSLPQGPDVSTPRIPGLGEQSRVVEAPVGRLLRAPGPNGDQWAVVRRDDVQPLTEVQARLLQADPAADVGSPVTINTSDFARLPLDSGPLPAGADQLPKTVPTLAAISGTACAQFPDAATTPKIVVDPTAIAPAAAAAKTGTPVNSRAAAADRVSVPFGKGVLVRSVPSGSAPAGSGTFSIVTDNGVRHAIGDTDALTRLGYGQATPQNMLSEIVSLLPEGPALSIEAAKAVAG
ncbi:type VII secretion protein EccB [Actinoplanes bogorensis]|uniref:Type VII secretion protein EccB n=1 Tax=Paractinoplanes bogorensis TaxID=1610840 RepID=A0ABS5Z3F4_9ACTN|nr:type VII secretion protein EccB [Actinoplanes bogorensis]MBU2670224.1 type VII secretion protein EccB [Actinoplanes bogorensis]